MRWVTSNGLAISGQQKMLRFCGEGVKTRTPNDTNNVWAVDADGNENNHPANNNLGVRPVLLRPRISFQARNAPPGGAVCAPRIVKQRNPFPVPSVIEAEGRTQTVGDAGTLRKQRVGFSGGARSSGWRQQKPQPKSATAATLKRYAG